MMNIRRARIEEASILTDIAMRSKAVWGYSNEFMEACYAELLVSSEKLENTKYLHYVVEEQGVILGYYSVEKITNTEYELEAIFIEPSSIRKGIGKKLMRHAKDLLVSRGVCSLVIQGDPNARGFYESLGGKQIGVRESESMPGRLLPLYRISLAREDVEQ